MCSCCVVPCTSWNGCLKKWIKTVCRRVVAMETASLEASFQSFLFSDNFLPILPLWTCTIPSWSTRACIKLPVMLQARKQEADLVGQNLGKQRWGCNVLWGSWVELTSPLAQRPSRRPQGRTDSFCLAVAKAVSAPAVSALLLWCWVPLQMGPCGRSVPFALALMVLWEWKEKKCFSSN